MKKAFLIICAFYFLVFAAIADKTIYVSPNGTGDGTTSGTPCKLGDAIKTKYDTNVGAVTTIVFPENTTFILTSTDGSSQAARFDFPDTSNKFIFVGNNSTLDGGNDGTYRIFRIAKPLANVEINNLNFINGKVTGIYAAGGAIYFTGETLKINNCTFNNCGSKVGGAIASRGKAIEIRNSYFSNNYLTADSGNRGAAITHTGISTGGTLLVENTTFNNNSGAAGAACYGTAICTAKDGTVSNYLSSITINNCTFYKNKAYVNTNNAYTAIYMDELTGTSPATTATFTNNTFYGNSNGALYIVGAKQTVKMVNNVIIGDSYPNIGGSVTDYGVLANTTLATRPAIIGNNNFIVAKLPVNPTITEASFQSGTNGNTFVSTTTQSVIDAVNLNATLSATTVPYLTITDVTSPLVNTGTNSVSAVTIPSTDMRGVARGGSNSGSGYDIGAFELSTPIISSNQNLSNLGITNTELAGAIISVTGGELTLDQSLGVNSIKVQPGAKLTLNSGSALTSGKINLQSNSTGTATFVDKNSVVSSVAGNVEQYLTSGRNWYIASPINNATTANLSSASSVVFYKESTAEWLPPAGSSLTAGEGYISSSTLTTGTVSFDGTLNTSTVTVPLTRTSSVTKEGFNLVGNPYPSYLNWALVDTTSAKVLSTIWYRTKTDQNSYTFDTYNGKGNVNTNLGATKITNLIPPMQAFWVRVKQGETSSNLIFTNAMRSHGDYSTNRFKAPPAKNQQLLRLEVSNGTNKDEALIYFNENASNGYEAYDSPKMSNGSTSIPEIYTKAGDEKLVINGLKSLDKNIEIPLGFSTGQSNTFTIKATEVSNFSSDVKISIIDKVKNEEHDMNLDDSYIFNSDIATTESRFAIVFKVTSIATDFEDFAAPIEIYIDNYKHIVINKLFQPEAINSVSVYNVMGQQIVEQNLKQTRTVIETNFIAGIYLVVIEAGNKKLIRKVIIK
jgi:hypothetical protein